MMAKRLTAALIVALVVSGLFTFLLSKRVSRSTPVAPKRRLYVTASTTLEAGQLLKANNLQLVEWPLSTPLIGAFDKIEDVVGRSVVYPLVKDEPILDRHLAMAGAGAGLTANIPAGMRAISVKSDEVVGVAGFLLPGTHVDVLLTYRSEKSPELRTATVLQDVVILAAGQQIHPDPESKPTTVNVVTLLLKPEDAERIVLATGLGGIHFVLRNGLDREQTTAPSIGLDELAHTTASLSSSDAANSRPRRSTPLTYDVETILGNKQVLSRFK
jgi:pilus assembly protein CpaB